MARQDALPRGFVQRCNNLARDRRARLGLDDNSPLDPFNLARSMGVKVLRPDELSLPREHGKELGEDGSSHWSALTVKVASGYVIIYNPTHTPVRINNSLCHELSHIILDHNHSELHRAFGTVLRDFHPELESQANRLASILLVPSPAVQLAKTNGGSVESLARDFVVSEDLARWRWNMVR